MAPSGSIPTPLVSFLLTGWSLRDADFRELKGPPLRARLMDEEAHFACGEMRVAYQKRTFFRPSSFPARSSHGCPG